MSRVLVPSPRSAPGRPARPTLTVHPELIAANTRALDAATAGQLMAVVKADGYGHPHQARTMLANGATWLGVTSVEEAFALRREGITAPVLSWLNPLDTDFAAAVLAGVDLAVPTSAHLAAVTEAAARLRRPARVHLFVDVGMAREGVPWPDWPAFCRQARAAERGNVRVVGLMGHLSSADRPDGEQHGTELRRFRTAVATARQTWLRPEVVHLATTTALFTDPETHFDLVRVGAGLYGIDPAGSGAVRGAMSLTAPVVGTRDVPGGTGVGYGHTHVTRTGTRLALVPLGYGDGVPRAASGRAQVLVRGRRCPVVGTVSMDQVVVDVGEMDVQLGETVTFFGPGDLGEPTIADWARWAGTIPNEIVTGIGRRVLRAQAPAPSVALPGLAELTVGGAA